MQHGLLASGNIVGIMASGTRQLLTAFQVALRFAKPVGGVRDLKIVLILAAWRVVRS